MLGWERGVPDCKAVREQRLNMKKGYIITGTALAPFLFILYTAGILMVHAHWLNLQMVTQKSPER